MTRLITLVMGIIVLAFSAYATPNFMTAPANNNTEFGENSVSGTTATSAKTDVFSNHDGNLSSLFSTGNPVASSNSNNALADVTFSVSTMSADVGDQICLDFSVTGFTDIVSAQYSMNWDETKLSYVTSQNYNLTDLNASAFGTAGIANGDLTLSWFHNATTGVSLPDGAVIYQVCFDVLAAAEGQTVAVGLSGVPTSIEVTDNTFAVQNFINQDGAITVNGSPPPPPASNIVFSVSSATADVGTQSCLDVSVAGFTNIESFQYSLNWDESLLGYASTQNYNLTDLSATSFGTGATATGDLTVTWMHSAATTGVTIPDGTVIYQVCFDVETGSEGQTAAVNISGNPLSTGATDNAAATVTFSSNNGQVSINGTPPPPPPSDGVTFSVSSSTADAGTQTCLDVSVEGFTNVVSFQYSMNWNENILDYASTQNFNLTDLNGAAFGTSNTASGNLTVSWLHQATTGVTVPDGTVIYQVCFDVQSGTDGQSSTIALSGTPTAIEVTDNTNSILDFTNEDGQVSVNDNGGGGNPNVGQLAFIVEQVTATNGEQTCLDVSVEGFTDIVSAQYSMNWDASALTYASVQNFNLTDLNGSAFGTNSTASGNLTMSWLHQATTGVTVPDGTVIYQVCFDVNGTDGQVVTVGISGNPTALEVTDNTSSQVTPTLTTGQITIQGNGGGGPISNGDLTFIMEDTDAEVGEMICLDVSVSSFADVVSAQYSMNWNPAELQFNNVQNFNLTDLNGSAFGTNSTANGDLTMSWLHQATTGVSVPDGTVIYQVCFTVLSSVGSTPLISFSGAPTSIEVTDNNSAIVPFFSNPGQITVVNGGGGGGGTDLLLTMESAVIEVGESKCLDISVDNFNTIVSTQYSVNWDETALEYTGVQNFNLVDLNASSFGTNGIANGDLTLSWFHQATTGVTLPAGTVIYQMCFDALTTGSSTISFSGSPTSIEATTTGNQVVPFTSAAGTVTVESGGTTMQDNDNLTFNIESTSANAGDNVCLDVSVDDFIDVVTAQYSMTWDENILEYTGVQNLNLQDLNTANFGAGSISQGQLTMAWDDTSATGVTVPNGTVIYQVCFDVIGASGNTTQVQIGNTPTVIEVTETSGSVLNPTFNSATVSVNGVVTTDDVVFQYGCIDGQPGETICIPVSSQNFDNIASFQYSMHWNENVLSFQNIQGYNLADLSVSTFLFNNTDNGTLGVVWDDSSGAGITKADNETLFEICFEVIGNVGQNTLMTFDGSPIIVEVSNNTGAILPVTFLQCAVNVVNNCPALSIAQDAITNVSCQGESNGAINVTITGGDGNNTFEWINNSNNAVVSTIEDVTGLAAGNYTLNVTTCGGSGTGSQTFQVTEPANAVSVEETLGVVTCFGGQNGTVSVTGQGGTGALTYSWTGGNLTGTVPGTSLAGLAAGTYNLTVTDANSCELTESFTVVQPTAQFTVNATVTNASCDGEANGAIDIAAAGGWGNYTYNWADGLSGTNPQNLSAGMYSLTVEDAEGCEQVINNIEVAEPAVIAITGTTTDVATDQTGEINITPTGGSGTGTYLFSWEGPDSFTAATEDLNNLSLGGQYCVTVTDVNNCDATECFTINSPLIIEIDEVQPSCAGQSNGFINISAFGGQGTITFSWTGGVTSASEDLSGLSGDTYTVLATDTNGGSASQVIELNEAAAAVSVTPAVTQLNADMACNGSINVSSVTGGFGGYSFAWDDVDNSTTSSINNLCAGVYTVTITDSEGCSTTSTTTIQYIPEILTIDGTMASAQCAGQCDGSVTVNILTGIAPFTIEVFDAANVLLDSALDSDGTETFTGYCAQTVSVTVTDNAGQVQTIDELIVTEPAALEIVSSTIFPVTTPGGNNGVISVNVEGGTPGYTYIWNSGSGQSNINLPVGNYTVTVEDDNGCQMTSEVFQVQLFQVAAFNNSDANCIGDTNGEACVNVSGGNGTYTYLWSSGEMTDCISGKTAGDYSVTITDSASGVSISQSTTIGTQSDLTVSASTTTLFTGGANVSCAGRSDGAATALAVGGINTVTYSWSNGTESQAISGVPAGLYTVTASDELGCIVTAEVVITEPAPFAVDFAVDGISCNGQRDGILTATTTGGAAVNTENYDYEWTGTGIVNAFLPTVNNLTAGLYTVNVTDPNGCEATATTELFEPEILEVISETTADDGTENGTARAIVTGGTEDYNYEWRSNGEIGTTQSLSGLAAGSYMVIVTDANGCEAMETEIIVQDNSLGCLDTRLVITPDNDGLNDEFVINCIENFAENRLEIYNRWGQLVFRQNDYDCGTDDCPNGWKGTNLRDAPLAGGGYFYVLEYTEDGQTKQLKGSITLLKE